MKFLLFFLLFASPVFADPEITKLGLGIGGLIHNRDPLYPNQQIDKWDNQFQWNLNIDWDNWFWDNKLHYESCNDKLCTAGWEFETGFRISVFRVYWWHHSQHTLDSENTYQNPLKYSLKDAAMLELNLIDKRRK